MGFAEEEVYNYIMKNLKNFRNIRVASLTDSLSCLTDADRDELHAREEARGSQATVYRLYQYLKCRQGWVRDLIEALRQNNAGDLANELQHVYDSWQPLSMLTNHLGSSRSPCSHRCLVPSCSQQCPSHCHLHRSPDIVSSSQPCSRCPVG